MSNHLTARYLVSRGYPIKNIRSAMTVLVGLDHSEIAESIGKKRTTVTNALLSSIGSRATLEAIAAQMGVQPEVIFADSQHYQK